MSRALNDDFLGDLKDGRLGWLVGRVIRDHTLCLELRGNAVNVYYRGGSLLEVRQTPSGYKAFHDKKYASRGPAVAFPKDLTDPAPWGPVFPQLKNQMDLWFGEKEHTRPEREFEQLIVRENNFQASLARSTDYFICDIEHRMPDGSRVDLVAVKWPSDPLSRKKLKGWPLALIEMKYCDSTLCGGAGIVEHLKDTCRVFGEKDTMDAFREDMLKVFNQKCDLGLIPGVGKLVSLSTSEPEVLFLIANHDPGSKVLLDQLEAIQDTPDLCDLNPKFMKASDFGYGLFDDLTMDLPTYIAYLESEKACRPRT